MSFDITLNHSSHEKIWGVTIDNKLSFDEHVTDICKTANKKLNALSRINHHMKQKQKEILLPSFIISHFSYWPLIWMFYSKKSTKKINTVHERSLRVTLKDYESPYTLLLEEAHQITFHQQCVNSLMIEVYRYLNGHSPHIMNYIFKLRKMSTISETSTSSRQKTLVHWNTGLMLFHIVLTNSGNKYLLISVRQLLWLFSKIALKLGNVKIVHVDLAKYLFKMSGISNWGPLITDRNLSINCSICMRHICI